MTVRRIVANIEAEDLSKARAFYHDFLGLDVLMDLGWILTFGSDRMASVQVSLAREGGSGTTVPDLSIEVDDIDDLYQRAIDAGFDVVYDLVAEPWGVRRFYVRDPFGKVINILSHV